MKKMNKRGQADGLGLFQSIGVGLLILTFIGIFIFVAMGKAGSMTAISGDNNATSFLNSMKGNVSDTFDWLPLVILALVMGAVLFIVLRVVRGGK